jgi:cytochrome oxidase Cu insertion factor (SCO1/SenC/PrrC family)
MVRAMLALAGLLLASATALAAIALNAGSDRKHLPASASGSPAQSGWPFHRLVPAQRLTTAAGGTTSLRSLRGRVVVLAPSLTLCHEVCPITTGAFIAMQARLRRAGLADRVAFVEATVDPWRDSPARLRAYHRLTGADFIQLTGSVAAMRRFWSFFGIGFKRVPQGRPADLDWWTHRPQTFDVEHVDGLFLIDAEGYERVFFPGYANAKGSLSQTLRSLLSADGLKNLAHPLNAWTQPQVLAAVGRLLGKRLPRAA